MAATSGPAALPPQRCRSSVGGMPTGRPTLFEFAGGEPAFLALAAAHHARCLADPELSHPFSHPDQHPQHVERLAALVRCDSTLGREAGALTIAVTYGMGSREELAGADVICDTTEQVTSACMRVIGEC